MKATPCPISEEELRHLYSDKKLTDQQIVDHLGQGATLKRVRSWRKRFNIPTLSRPDRYDVPPIEGSLQSLLVGSMLGDGGLTKVVYGARYAENHCLAQRDYLEWKRQQWGDSWNPSGLRPRSWKLNGKIYEGVGLTTVTHPFLLEWYDLFYPEPGPKKFPAQIVPLVDSFAFAVWFLDDGNSAWWPLITFGSDSGSWRTAQCIFEKFELSPRWVPKKGRTGEFIFKGYDQADRFVDLIKDHVPQCMKYKLNFGYRGRHYEISKSAPEKTLRDMAQEGVPIRAMAKALGLSASVVSRRLEKLGIPHPRTVGRPRK